MWQEVLRACRTGDHYYEAESRSPAKSSSTEVIAHRVTPPALTPREIEQYQAAQETMRAIEGVHYITRRIVEVAPCDPETYALMLRLREAYVRGAEQKIERRLRSW